MTIKLIDNWRDAWRFFSNIAAGLLAALSLIQADALPAVQPLVPAQWWPYVSGGFAVAIVILRLISQPSLHAAAAVKDAA